MSNHGFFKQRFTSRKGTTNIPVDYIEEHMEDDDLNTAMTSPPLTFVARINSFSTTETKNELEK